VQDGVQREGVNFHLFVNKQNTRFEEPKNPHRVMEMSLHPAEYTVWCAVRPYWTDLCGGHNNKVAIPAAIAK
jgi:hypothetical protein